MMNADADRAGRGRGGGAGRAADRLLPAVPELQQGRLRRDRLPQEIQRPVQLPQRAAQDGRVRHPEQVPRRQAHVRRFLRAGHRHGPLPRQIRYVSLSLCFLSYQFVAKAGTTTKLKMQAWQMASVHTPSSLSSVLVHRSHSVRAITICLVSQLDEDISGSPDDQYDVLGGCWQTT
jgi:hypothetical protein